MAILSRQVLPLSIKLEKSTGKFECTNYGEIIMGLIKAFLGATLGTMADQWKEFFTCDALNNDTLMARGRKQTSTRSSNTNGHDNVISKDSGIAVADGQCVIIIDQGEVRDVVAEPGLFTYQGGEPSIFAGGLGEGVKGLIKTSWERFKYGGDTGKDQRVYYINMKEILDNKFGTANPIPFHIVDQRIGKDQDFSVRCNGWYTFRITNPVAFYTKICANVHGDYAKETLISTMRNEFVCALNRGFEKLSNLNIRPYALPQHVDELTESMNEVLSKKWGKDRGIIIESIAINRVILPEESQTLKEVQGAASLSNSMQTGDYMTGQTGAPMQTAANNPNNAMRGFVGMGMGMTNAMDGAQVGDLFSAGPQQQCAARFGATPQNVAGGWTCKCGTLNSGKFCFNCGKPQPTICWTCKCGTLNSGKFCFNCGKPQLTICWTCVCGAVNQGKFCANCGKPQPAPVCAWICTCGTENLGKFCFNCGMPNPSLAGTWICACGAQNLGKFCSNCGMPNPSLAGAWTCACGAQNLGKFCFNCGSTQPSAYWICACGTVNKGNFCNNCGKPRS